jgi:outer membrane receptor for ferrienterochelin and colicins
LGLQAQGAGGFMGRLGYAIQETESRETRQKLSNSPEHLVKLNLSAPVIKEKLFAGLEVQYTSSRLTVQGNSAPGFWVANFTVFSQNIAKGLDLSASVYNLLDKHFADPGNSANFTQPDLLPRDGRSFRLKMTYRF